MVSLDGVWEGSHGGGGVVSVGITGDLNRGWQSLAVSGHASSVHSTTWAKPSGERAHYHCSHQVADTSMWGLCWTQCCCPDSGAQPCPPSFAPGWGVSCQFGFPQPCLPTEDPVVQRFLAWDRNLMLSDKVPAWGVTQPLSKTVAPSLPALGHPRSSLGPCL